MKKVVPFFCLILLSLSAGAGTLYRWVDAEGKVHYTDEPPPASAKAVQQKVLKPAGDGEENLPYAVKLAAQKYPVTLYVTDCGEACSKAREHLAKRGVPHSVKDPSANRADAEALKKLIGKLEVPVLVVGSNVNNGYQAGTWDATLDAAGYPKTSQLPKPAPKKSEPAPAKPSDAASAPAAK